MTIIWHWNKINSYTIYLIVQRKTIRVNERVGQRIRVSRSCKDPCVSSKRRVSSSTTLILGTAISADALSPRRRYGRRSRCAFVDKLISNIAERETKRSRVTAEATAEKREGVRE